MEDDKIEFPSGVLKLDMNNPAHQAAFFMATNIENNDYKFLDWKGNEVKAGMTIYFVQTKPINLGRMGLLIPAGSNNSGKVEEIWESDEDYEKRKNQDIWELGDEYKVLETEGKLFVSHKDGDYTFVTPLTFSFYGYSTIAIKGVSDIK